MAWTVTRADVWAATIEDRPGGLSEKLLPLSEAGANLEFLISRRTPEAPGKGVVFVTPLSGPKQTRAAKAHGFSRSASLHSLRVEAPNKAGAIACMTSGLAAAGVNLRGVSAAAVGRKSVIYLAFDSAADARKAQRLLASEK